MDNETRVAPVLACRSCFPSSFFSSDFVASFIAVVVQVTCGTRVVELLEQAYVVVPLAYCTFRFVAVVGSLFSSCLLYTSDAADE